MSECSRLWSKVVVQRPPRTTEAGTTIIEATVTSMVVLIVLAIAFAVVGNLTAVSAKQQQRSEALDAAEVAIHQLTHDVRRATAVSEPIGIGGVDGMRFHASQPDNHCVEYRVLSGGLDRRTKPGGGSWTGWRRVVSGLVNRAFGPVSAFERNGATIEIKLLFAAANRAAATTTFDAAVTARNLTYGLTDDPCD